MKETPKYIVLDYIQLAKLFHYLREERTIGNNKDRKTLGLTLKKDCFHYLDVKFKVKLKTNIPNTTSQISRSSTASGSTNLKWAEK